MLTRMWFRFKQLDYQLIVLCLFFFFLPAANSYPGRAYYHVFGIQGYDGLSLTHLLRLPTILLPFYLGLVQYLTRQTHRTTLNFYEKGIMLALFLWFVGGSISLLTNASVPGILTNYIANIVSPFLICLVFFNVRLTTLQRRKVFFAFTLGCLFPLILGLYAYYVVWGIPNEITLISSHWDLEQMRAYSLQTFGNPSNTHCFMGLIGIVFFALILDKNLTRSETCCYAFVFLLAMIHLVILQGRSTLVCFLPLSLFICFLQGRQIFLGYLGVLLLVLAMFVFVYPEYLKTLVSRTVLAITWEDYHGDVSASERLDSIKQGWLLFKSQPLTGHGMGSSFLNNRYTTAHQFNVQAASELGVLGFVASIMLCVGVFYKFVAVSMAYCRKKCHYHHVVFMSAPMFYFMCAVFANVPLNLGVVNTWIALIIALLSLRDHAQPAETVFTNPVMA